MPASVRRADRSHPEPRVALPWVVFARVGIAGAALGLVAVGCGDAGRQTSGMPADTPRGQLEEVLSIGSSDGPEPTLLGSVSAAWLTRDRIYLVDAQAPIVRAFDLAGEYLHDVGRPGQGPGEYGQPMGLAVSDDGTVLVTDPYTARLGRYAANGTFLDSWPLGSSKSGLGLVLGLDGAPHVQVWDAETQELGMQAVGPDGPTGPTTFPPAVEFEQPSLLLSDGMRLVPPLSPEHHWARAPGGEMIAGFGAEYRLIVQDPDATTRRLIERSAPPQPVEASEAEFRARLVSRALQLADLGHTVAADDLPSALPAFTGLYPDRAGRLWVTRPGPAQSDPHCIDALEYRGPLLTFGKAASTQIVVGPKGGTAPAEPITDCWRRTRSFDLLDLASGELLATIPAPEPGFVAPLFADAQHVLASVTDVAGTVRLKLYELVLGNRQAEP